MIKPAVTIIGGGMITHDQILPSLYHLQRLGVIGDIAVCAQQSRTVKSLADAESLRQAFPGQSFRAYPPVDSDPNKPHPDLYKSVVAQMPPRNIVIMALPDQLHYDAIMTALRANQHVCAVKPLVLNVRESIEIEREARERGLVVGVEYHKRFDDRSLMARRRYRAGLFGDFRLGTACLMEKWYYRHSNFKNWFTIENSDAFTYIGCHYVDLVHYITGLLPAAVSVYGVRDSLPTGREGFLWTDARVIWNNGACLNVQNSLSFPDDAAGPNTQYLTMYFSKGDKGGYLQHSDQYRGLAYCYIDKPSAPGATTYFEPSADYFQYQDFGGPGLEPVGYGYRSVKFIVEACIRVEKESEGLPADKALARRQELLSEIDATGIMATPANSRYNELVIEAARMSIMNGGREAAIDYAAPSVNFRQYPASASADRARSV
jgi:D-galacturonate reductase